MASSINLGGFSTIGGKTVSNGLASGLDVEAIVTAAVDAKKISVTKMTDKLTLSNSKSSAFTQLQSLMGKLQTTASYLRNPPGINSANSNIFAFRQPFLTSNTSVPGNTYLGVTSAANSQVGKYTISDIVMAKARVIRSDTFTSKTASITDAAGTNNAGRFSAGTFQLTSGKMTASIGTATGDVLTTGDITSSGTAGSSVLNNAFGTGGIDSINISGTGEKTLIGSLAQNLTAVSAKQPGGVGTDVTVTVTINGKAYTSNVLPANSGGGSNEIAAGSVMTFTNAASGTSFAVQLGGAVEINGTSDLATFSSNLQNDLKSVTFSQTREISNFTAGATTGTTLVGLTSANVKLTSSAFNTTDNTHGKMEAFKVTAVSAPGAGDGSISVVIDGETYQATGLGDGSDQITGNITLQSASGKSLALNLGDAGVTLDISTQQNADVIKRDLNNVFGTGAEITINEGDSLVDIAAAINAKKQTTGVSATIVSVGPNDYRLTLQSEDTGLKNAFSIVDVNDVFGSTVNFTQTQAAADASFTLNNDLVITRPTNTISDVIDGTTFSLYQDTPPGTDVTVDVSRDTSSAKDGIVAFIDAYNDIRAFVAKQRERDTDTGQLKATAVIGSEPLLDTVLSRLENELNGFVKGLTNGDPSRLSDLGISFSDFAGDADNPATSNILTYDDTKLTNALESNFDAVKRIFEFTLTSSSDKLAVYSRTNDLKVSDFSVDIDITRTAGDQVRVTYTDPTTGLPTTVNADFTPGTGTGGTITGKDGTALKGLKLIYTGDGTDTITVNASQGIADRMFNALDEYTKDGGVIDSQIDSYATSKTNIQKDIDRANERIEELRDRLLAQFSALESVIKQANSLLQFLDAQSAAYAASNQ